MKTYAVMVQSSGYSADYTDHVLVLAHDEADAEWLASVYVRDNLHGAGLDVRDAFAIELDGAPRAIGTIVYPGND